MITSWRIVSNEHVETAFTGEGAMLYGGRWNLEGSPMVYTAQSAALAALELLVRFRRGQRMRDYVLFACSFSDSLADALDTRHLPADWRSDPPPPQLQEMGESWLRSGLSAVLRVPSAVIATEFNYLFNPEHNDFKKIEIAEPIPFSLDLRLLRR